MNLVYWFKYPRTYEISISSLRLRICISSLLLSLSRSSNCLLMAWLWSRLAFNLALSSETCSCRLLRAACTAENVASPNAGDLALDSGDLDLLRTNGEAPLGEVDLMKQVFLGFYFHEHFLLFQLYLPGTPIERLLFMIMTKEDKFTQDFKLIDYHYFSTWRSKYKI